MPKFNIDQNYACSFINKGKQTNQKGTLDGRSTFLDLTGQEIQRRAGSPDDLRRNRGLYEHQNEQFEVNYRNVRTPSKCSVVRVEADHECINKVQSRLVNKLGVEESQNLDTVRTSNNFVHVMRNMAEKSSEKNLTRNAKNSRKMSLSECEVTNTQSSEVSSSCEYRSS